MKHLVSILLISIFLCIVKFSCAQRMVQSVSDIRNLKINETQFIGKPLKVLLVQIKPKILIVEGNLPNINPEANSFINFRFVDRKEYDSIKSSGKFPTTVRIIFALDDKRQLSGKPLIMQRIWTKEDEIEYGTMST